MPSVPPIDPAAIENLRALNPDDDDSFLRDIVGIYLEDTPLRLTELRESLAAGDQPKFTRAAHSIKGSSSNLGANHVRATAEKLEHESRNNGLAAVADLVATLENDFATARAELEKLVAPAS